MKLLKKENYLSVFAVVIMLMLAGTFLDMNISKLLYHSNNPIAYFFQMFGEFPVMLCGFSASALLLASLPKKGMSRIIFLILAAGGALCGLLAVKEILEYSSGIVMFISIAAEVAIAALMFRYVFTSCDRSNPGLLRRTAMFILFTVLIATVIVIAIKIPWGRPRYRSVIVFSNLKYQPWYKIGKAARDAFEGILDHEEFKSFPSGHAASAAYLLTLVSLKNVIPSLKDKEGLLTAIAFVWIILTCIFRIVAGAHFLTDVTIGFTAAFASLVLVGRSMKINKRKKQ